MYTIVLIPNLSKKGGRETEKWVTFEQRTDEQKHMYIYDPIVSQIKGRLKHKSSLVEITGAFQKQ